MIIGATSWQIPGTYLENLELMYPSVDFTELLVYTWDEQTKALLDEEWEKMLILCPLSIHLPTDSLTHVREALEYFREKEVYRLTMHPFLPLEDTLEIYLRYRQVYQDRLLLENLENGLFDRMIERYGTDHFRFTFDVGHYFLLRKDICEFFRAHGNRIGEIHFHGVFDKKDHSFPDEGTFKYFADTVKQYDSLVNVPVCVELFEWEKTCRAIERLRDVG
jgi:sugar phosphate isomerase/epimerase